MRTPLTVAIPTYNRGAILIQTVERLLAMNPRADQILIVDQTLQHTREVTDRLESLRRAGDISLFTLEHPSIPHAMNLALAEASNRFVLFVDDDVEPSEGLFAAHLRAYDDPSVFAVVGQVLQPGESPHTFDDKLLRRGAIRDLEFRFNHTIACDVESTIACNLSVDRERALRVGGFDENYIGAAHRFETDFAKRVVAAGGRVRFEPAASLRHLKLSTGGLRSYGNHMTNPSPMHSVGDYYFALHYAPSLMTFVLSRLRRNVLTRFHATHPWTMPAKLAGELRGLRLARRLFAGGRKLWEGQASAGE